MGPGAACQSIRPGLQGRNRCLVGAVGHPGLSNAGTLRGGIRVCIARICTVGGGGDHRFHAGEGFRVPPASVCGRRAESDRSRRGGCRSGAGCAAHRVDAPARRRWNGARLRSERRDGSSRREQGDSSVAAAWLSNRRAWSPRRVRLPAWRGAFVSPVPGALATGDGNGQSPGAGTGSLPVVRVAT